MNKTENPLRTLAQYIVSIKIEELPAQVKQAAVHCLVDTVGAAIGGLDYDEVPEVIETFQAYSGHYCERDPRASVWGTHFNTSVFQASFLNGILSHALELDDVHTGSKTHIGAVVAPAAWSVAEAITASGANLIEALVAGYETMSRIGRGFGVSDHRLKGWHVSGTAGTFGAAAAAAKLLGLDAERTLAALGMAGTQSSGVWAFLGDGATSKKLHTGRSAENGVVAAFLAKAGMTGPEHILDSEDGGLYRTMSGSSDLSEVSRKLGTVFEILNVDKKPYSCCRSMHPAIDAILSVKKELGLPASQIKKVKIRSYEVGIKQCGIIMYPANTSESKFSMRFGVAVAYIDGLAGKEQFSTERINDPEVRALAARVDYIADSEFTSRYPKNWGCSLEVTIEDGSVIKKEVLDASGSVANPMTVEQLKKKFKSLVSSFVGNERSELILKSLENMENIPEVSDILSLHRGK
ncbi:MAG: MmgE/PrpD family protein [Synergistaceae bacterium]|nr:MmgE/PrpD family protein [Synergistaceae bacterium]